MKFICNHPASYIYFRRALVKSTLIDSVNTPGVGSIPRTVRAIDSE